VAHALFFLGNTFLASGETMRPTPTKTSSITELKIESGVFDTVFVTNNVTADYSSTIDTTWDYDTILCSLFNNTLLAGNVDFDATQVLSMRVKRRVKGSYQWLTLYENPVNSSDDLSVEVFDRYNASNTEYEYAIVVVATNNTEGSYNIATADSKFSGIYIVEKDSAFKTKINARISGIQRNQQVTTINTLGSKYPFHIKNSVNNYESGNVSGFFVDVDTNTNILKIPEGFAYRKLLNDFLTDGKPKILKSDDGRVWLISVVGTPSESENSHKDFIISSFDWEECGNSESSTDLYNAGLIDVNIEVT